MDIQVSSNFERLLFEAYRRDAASIRAKMAQLSRLRSFSIDAYALSVIRADFDAFSVSEEDTSAEIARLWREARYLCDPHTAVGVSAARRQAATRGKQTPLVVLGTAHAAKFPDAIEAAAGVRPPLPAHLSSLLERKERITILPNDQDEIERFIKRTVSQMAARAAS
jgi:threonine synthase